MGTSDEQATRELHEREQDSSEGEQGRADSDDDRERDEEEEQQKKDEEEEEEEDTSRPDLWKKFAGALPLIFGLGFCVAFFVWVCLQMAGQTVGGPPLLLGIFGGAILGIAAAGAAMGVARLADKSNKD